MDYDLKVFLMILAVTFILYCLVGGGVFMTFFVKDKVKHREADRRRKQIAKKFKQQSMLPTLILPNDAPLTERFFDDVERFRNDFS